MTDLRLLANEHWRLTYRFLTQTCAGEWRRFGTVDAFRSRTVRHSFANGCLVLDPAQPRDLAEAIGWLAQRDVEYLVRMDVTHATPELLAVPAALGLEGDATWRMPGMVLETIPPGPARPRHVAIRQLDSDQLESVRELFSASPHARFLGTLANTAIDNERFAIYVASLDGRLVATSAVVRTGDSCGIYAVGTEEWAQRRGVGTAVTWATLDHARAWGCTSAVLQSSPVGVPVYERMGFRAVVEYQLFAARPQQGD